MSKRTRHRLKAQWHDSPFSHWCRRYLVRVYGARGRNRKEWQS